MTWNGPAKSPTEAAMREFITREIGRLLRTDEFANDFVAEAERMLAGIRSMLPPRRGTSPAAADLAGTLVIAEVAGGPGRDNAAQFGAQGGPEEVIGILRGGPDDYRVYDTQVGAAGIRPLTREDVDTMRRLVEQSVLSWPGPAAEAPE